MTARTGWSLLCLTAALASAQQGQLSGPVAGYVFDSSARALRPVLGIPGASVLGSSIDSGMAFTSATVSPKLNSVAAIAADGSFHIFTLQAGAAREVAVNGVATVPERIVYSPAGSAAALYSGGRIQVLTGLPSAPVPGSSFDLASGGRRTVAGSIAVSDDGACVLVAGAAGVTLLGSGAAKSLISGHNLTVAFAPGSHDAAVAGLGVALIKDAAGTASMQVLAADDPTQLAVGVAFATGGAKLYVASAVAQNVAAFDLAAGTRTPLACDCTPTGLTPMGEVYRLTELGSDPLWLLDPSAPRIVFVPAKSAASAN